MAMLWKHDLWEQIEQVTANFANPQGTCCLKEALVLH